MTIDARIERLERRLLELEDERAILDTLYAYAHSLDYGDRGTWLDCWSEDAELHWPHETFRGVDEIGRAFDGHSHAPQAFHKHFLVEPRIRLDGDTASVSSYFSRINDSADGPVVRSFGRYLDTFVRCADGRWRIRRRELERESLIPNAPVT
jgi:ketosteroid isomerase-like protein